MSSEIIPCESYGSGAFAEAPLLSSRLRTLGSLPRTHAVVDSMAAVANQKAPIPTFTEAALADLRDNYEVGIGILAAIRAWPCGTRAEFDTKAVELSDLTIRSLGDAGRACARGPVHAAGGPAPAAPGAGATTVEWRWHQTDMDRAAFVAHRHPRASLLQETGGAVSAAQGQAYDGALPLPCALLQSTLERRLKIVAQAGIDRHC